ncbi:predicted protein [Chaetomium globosum CBS 148.51]|uniref:Uncharacterized protein n=1 Tax=Chaetomium globosum (strain ATCC 6205 / CBS 148.51 / DSM 1962 / NBRC 6347 / NRRL 1970) TaxID=306901 RepID=Q2GQP2_CHAGB|nr:uncharacterized protein CHGG_09712 [Chaetomium globosum CBS 148.51]EAQ83308.1 predicted protein [Chaetomium globosum CBS 148.51]
MALAYPAVDRDAPVKRQNAVTVDVSQPAMSDQTGNVIAFDSTKVYQDAAAKGI